MCLNNQAATVACRTELSNISQKMLQQHFAKLSLVIGISTYPQNLWITLWTDYVEAALKWRSIRIIVTLPIF
jgi:hypothetical protein